MPPIMQSDEKCHCCGKRKCESGLRNNYFLGKRLSVDSFRVEQKYQLERRRLLNRAIHGWGVVYGFEIKGAKASGGKANDAEAQQPAPGELVVEAGLALDNCGRELVEVGSTIGVEDVVILDAKGKAVLKNGKPLTGPDKIKHLKDNLGGSPREIWWLLRAHYAERKVSEVNVLDSCRCDHSEWDHTCETVYYSLQMSSPQECCSGFGCGLECECQLGPCCGEPRELDRPYGDGGDTRLARAEFVMIEPAAANRSAEERAAVELAEAQFEAAKRAAEEHAARRDPTNRGGPRGLCDHLTYLQLGCECEDWVEIPAKCDSRVRVDIKNRVRLACVKLVSDGGDGVMFGAEVEPCGPRRLVKRNDLLFDLIRGCDLTRIKEIDWKPWHRATDAISYKDFARALMEEGSAEAEPGHISFHVTFSRPVLKATVRPDCFAMTILSRERLEGWWQVMRVPIVKVKCDPPDPLGPAYVSGARPIVDRAWARDCLKGAVSIFQGVEARVEFEIRGDFIVDCNGQSIDANSAGLSAVPSGNGTPGGAFLSTFRVGPAPEVPEETVSGYSDDSPESEWL
jgi:hypothetical protein